MTYRNEKFGNELWHSFFTAALTGVAAAAYDKKDFKNGTDSDLEEIRENVISEALFIADVAMDNVITRSAYDQSYKDADEQLIAERQKKRELFRHREENRKLGEQIINDEINEKHRREADLLNEFSEAELREMRDV